MHAPSITPTITNKDVAHCWPRGELGFAPLLLEDDDDDDDVELVRGVAMAEVGEYVTSLLDAATSKTDPPPYS